MWPIKDILNLIPSIKIKYEYIISINQNEDIDDSDSQINILKNTTKQNIIQNVTKIPRLNIKSRISKPLETCNSVINSVYKTCGKITEDECKFLW